MPLLWAAKKGHDVVVKLLLKTEKVDIDLKSSTSWTPLLWAVKKGYDVVIKLLLETVKVDIDLKSSFG